MGVPKGELRGDETLELVISWPVELTNSLSERELWLLANFLGAGYIRKDWEPLNKGLATIPLMYAFHVAILRYL
jgi:hypothetical protein